MTLTQRTRAAVAAFLSAAGIAVAGPSDIDIFSGTSNNDKPNVLVILDSSANWSSAITRVPNCYYKEKGVTTTVGPDNQGTKFAIEKCALYNLVDALPVSKSGDLANDAEFNIAIMLMNEPNNSGAYPRKAFIPLTSNNKPVLKKLIADLSINGDKGSNADFGQAMYEAYLYFRGLAPLNGAFSTESDSAAFSGGKYVSPSTNSCARNYIVVIGNGSPQNSSPEGAVQSLMSAAIDVEYVDASATVRTQLKSKIVNAALGTDEASWSDEMARFLRGVDFSGKVDIQGIVTHAIAVKKGPSDGSFPALMNSIANQGGGSYLEATDADNLLMALLDTFNSMQAANSVFSAASLPVSTSGRGTYLNQIFLGSFRPDAEGKPRWRGNLKQYRFGLDGLDNLSITDATGAPAINASTGFFNPSAVSYWTEASEFWMNQPMGTPPSASDRPDGEVVEKGGVAQRLRTDYATSQTARPVYTCISCAAGTVLGSTAATRFEEGNSAITQSILGVSSVSDRAALIDWVRGTSNAGDEKGPTTATPTTVRPSIHGDVLHSRPAVVNFGGSTGVVVFYGANDGQLRAVGGSQTGSTAGRELWSFIPQEVMGSLPRLRNNKPGIELSTTPAGAGATPREYGVDGPIGVYQKIGTDGSAERVILYVGFRRGGSYLYAIDVTTPTAPRFLWKLSRSSAGMSAMAQTWSEPKPARVKGYTNPVVIFGGGYDDVVEDGDSGGASEGNAVFVVDAFDGRLVKAFSALDGGASAGSIGRSIAADVALADTDFDGKIDRAYAIDLGGQIYRIDFESDAGIDPKRWTIYRFADLSGGTMTGRKFFFPPDVVVTKRFAALLVGSGDREKPLRTATQDHFFQLFDRHTVKGLPALPTPIVWGDLKAMGDTPNTDGAGCYMALAQGEKVVNAATSIGGFSYFGTNRPTPPSASSTSCSANLGVAKSYAMPLFCTATTGSVLVGGGLPPSPVAGIVTVQKADGTSVQVPFVIGAPNPRNSAIEGSRIRLTVDQPRKRKYWYQETQR